MLSKFVEYLPILSELPGRLSPEFLSGEQGANRELRDTCQLTATNDYEAVICWLNEYRHTPTTYRNYQKEAERLLLWCLFKHKKALSSLNRADLEEYFNFLADPQPQALWCALSSGKNGKRGTPQWRPFIGPLSESAQKTAISIINSLLSYLLQANYIAKNPIDLMRRRAKRQPIDSEEELIKLQERILEPDEWEAMVQTLEESPANTAHEKQEKARLRFIVVMLYFLGLRINELSTHTWRAFRKRPEGWWFYVKGKGGKVGKIPVNPILWEEVEVFRHQLGLPPNPMIEEANVPLVPSWKSDQGLGVRYMGELLKTLALETAKRFTDSPEKQKKLAGFSPHWLRHLSASMQDRMGVAFKHVQANLRHSSEATTRRYVHAFDKERHQDMSKLVFMPDIK